ncbi:MAG TPA: NAD(P)-binding domain-containing protein, partial [Pirellulaceae bacterium]
MNQASPIREMAPVCVVGAGPCGLAACKNLAEHGIPHECLERQDDVGGHWYGDSPHSGVYASTHLISSKKLTEFDDFRMPKQFPQYPHHSQAFAYLRDYAQHFRLRDRIRFRTTVQRIHPREDGWLVSTADGNERFYSAVILAHGHHVEPHLPEIPGRFAGATLHSKNYKTPDLIRNQRLLIIGAGNSGCDLAVEAAYHARSVTLSLRRGYHILPKYLFGTPLDRCGEQLDRWLLPGRVKRRIAEKLIQVAVGPVELCGLPRPAHRLFTTHPIVNSHLPLLVAHQRVQVKPDVVAFHDYQVDFQDGTSEEFDLVIFATGYQLSFPFVDLANLNGSQGVPELFLNAFHPTRDDVVVAGMFQPNGGIWKLAD